MNNASHEALKPSTIFVSYIYVLL